jgi:CheY-like chemotaxis protein
MKRAVTGQELSLVLVVDDDAGMRQLLRYTLEPVGYRVEEAADGVQALSAYERLRPDIVLLDIMMPRMDGYATCAQIRALPGGDRTPVIMVTALDDPEAIDRAYKVGATDYVTKPLLLDDLCTRVHDLLQAELSEATAG